MTIDRLNTDAIRDIEHRIREVRDEIDRQKAADGRFDPDLIRRWDTLLAERRA